MARAVAGLAQYHKSHNFLCLPPATGDIPESGVIVSSPACPTRKPIEHAGHVYQQKVIRAYSVHALPPEEDEQSSDSPEKPKKQNNAASPADTASTLASKIAVGSDDLYELLELGEKRWHATADDIKKSFRRISLLYHPDKIAHLGEEARDNSEAHFKAVMKAYDILSDKKKRAAYDSIDDVDDSIPSEREAASASPERFYEKFGTCFALNARWSTDDRVPVLGDDNTDMDTVEKFYNFWYSFKSWRDFSFDLEYDTDQAQCREEKRWMERQNAKSVKGKKVEESIRIRKLVDLAHKHDPRLQRMRSAAKEQKDARKQEKKRRAEEQAQAERERQEREKVEAERKAVEEKAKRAAAKKEKENARQLTRKARQKLRAVGRELGLLETDSGAIAIEKMCSEGNMHSIDAVAVALGELDSGSSADVLTRASELLQNALKDPHTSVGLHKCNGNGASSPEEYAHSETDSTKTNGHSAESENTDGGGSVAEKNSSETIWTADELSLLSKGVAKFPGGTRDRWERLATYIGTKSADEVLRKVNESRPSKIKAKVQPQAPPPQREDAKAFERFQEKKKGKPATSPPKEKSSGKPASSSRPPNKLSFSPKEQNLFEAALKKYPANSNGRWANVGKSVGRSADECQERFNELIAFFQARRQAQ